MTLHALLVLVGVLLCQAQDSHPAAAPGGAAGELTGRWRALKVSNGSLGETFEFHPDGRVDYSYGAVVESSYRIENGLLVLPPSTTNGPEIRRTMEWSGSDKLTLGEPKVPDNSSGASETLTRRGSRGDPKNPIAGEWAGTRDMGGRKLELLWIFYPGGKTLFLLPITSLHGKYSVIAGGSTLRLELEGQEGKEDRFSVAGDVLTFSGYGGRGEAHYARY